LKLFDSILRLYSRVAPSERGGFRLARLARRLRPASTWETQFDTPEGTRLTLNLATYPDCCMAYGLYELDTSRLIKRLLRPGDHFVDGGANIGYFTLLASRRVGAGGRVDAFEPQPDNRARLEANVAMNAFAKNVRVHPLAIGDAAREAVIHRPVGGGFNHGESSLFKPGDGETKDTAIQIARMDEALAGTRPRLVKLDIEGAEPLAIDGMAGLVRQPTPPMVLMEHNTVSLARGGFAPPEAVDRLRRLNREYRVYRVGRRLTPIEATARELEALKQVNLLFARPADLV